MTNPLTPRMNKIETGGTWKVGDVKQSFLTEAQFQAEHDDTWILCDGGSAAGTDYEAVTGESTVPDVRGRFLRAKDHTAGVNPDGDTAVRTPQADEFKSHYHTADHSATGGSPHGTGPSGPTWVTGNTSSVGGAETRPVNITVNVFIKVNREPSS